MENNYLERGSDAYAEATKLSTMLEQLLEQFNDVTKLKKHPIRGWSEHLSEEIAINMVHQGHLVIIEYEVDQLFNDFRNTRNNILKAEILKLKNELVFFMDRNISRSLRESYRIAKNPATQILERPGN
jgi:hypothetical protein